MKDRGQCKICKEPIVFGDMTKRKDGNYYCVICHIYLNRNIEFKEILYKRKNELLFQLGELEFEINKLKHKDLKL